jgi:hypothetical protein
MPIVANSKLSSSVANATFLDKTQDDTFTGTLTLRKSPSDTNQVADAQDAINNNTRLIVSNEAISASGTITKDDNILTQVRRVSGDSAAVTTSTTPFGSSASTSDGVVIILRGFDATNTVTIEHNDIQYGAILNGDATLGLYDQLELMYDSTAERWIEQKRNF